MSVSLHKGCFVTGTDTEVGKTFVSLALMQALQNEGKRVVGYKPVAAGCERDVTGALRNEDALALQQQSSLQLGYAQLNPYAFEPPIAPHIAAAQVNVSIDLGVIEQGYADLRDQADAIVVEGAGGWLVPIDGERTLADVALAIGLPVVLVVGMRLGCINHALLTAAAVRASGLPLAGWVANHLSPDQPVAQENLTAIAERIGAPLLGEFPWYGRTLPSIDVRSACIRLSVDRPV